MPAADVLPGFLVAVLIILIAPGPDMAFVVASGVGSGPRAGVMAAVGMSAGMLVHTILAALGLAAVLHAAPGAITAIRLLGAAYLAYLAFDTLRSARSAGIGDGHPEYARAFFKRAAITNLANPKIILFFAAFMPQFISPQRGNIAAQFLVLGIIFLVLGLLVDSLIGLSAGHLRSALAKGSRTAMTLNVLSGVAFATIAVLLVAEVVRG